MIEKRIKMFYSGIKRGGWQYHLQARGFIIRSHRAANARELHIIHRFGF